VRLTKGPILVSNKVEIVRIFQMTLFHIRAILMVKYYEHGYKNQIPPQDFWSGYDLQRENSFYYPRMYTHPNGEDFVAI
jgi:hypothetical protein